MKYCASQNEKTIYIAAWRLQTSYVDTTAIFAGRKTKMKVNTVERPIKGRVETIYDSFVTLSSAKTITEEIQENTNSNQSFLLPLFVNKLVAR